MSNSDPFRPQTSMSSRLGPPKFPAGCFIAFLGAFFTIFAVVFGGIMLSTTENAKSTMARGTIVLGMAAVPLAFLGIYLFVRARRTSAIPAVPLMPAVPPSDERFQKPIDWKIRRESGTPAPPSSSAPPPSEPTVVEKSTSSAGRVVFFAAIAIFWNAVVAVFWTQLDDHILNKFFIVPFVIGGAVLVATFIHGLLGLTNPSVRLTLDRSTVPLGGRLRLRYELIGRTGAIRRLFVTLEGKEIAVFRRGTKSHTARHTFSTSPVLEADDQDRIREGNSVVEIPTNTMHSFVTHHNTIAWVIRIKATIPIWPDVDVEFPITVTPHESATGEVR